MLLLRISLLGLFLWMSKWPIEKFNTGEYLKHELGFYFGLAFYSLFPLYLVWTLLGVMWVKVNLVKSEIHFIYLFRIVKIKIALIDGYYKTTAATKLSTFEGFLFKFGNGKVIEVSGYNVKSISKLQLVLNEYKVPMFGFKESWFPYTRKI